MASKAELNFIQPNPGHGVLCEGCEEQIPLEQADNDFPCQEVEFEHPTYILNPPGWSPPGEEQPHGTLPDGVLPGLVRLEDGTEQCFFFHEGSEIAEEE